MDGTVFTIETVPIAAGPKSLLLIRRSNPSNNILLSAVKLFHQPDEISSFTLLIEKYLLSNRISGSSFLVYRILVMAIKIFDTSNAPDI